jgi:DNA-binding response OmpR family regulator
MLYKILVIEDEFDIRDVVSQYLKIEGFEVMEAENGLQALSLFNKYDFNMVISDVMMPGIDGFEVLKTIRMVSDVPVIMLTAKAEEVDRLKGFKSGADDYMTKPFSPKELILRVKVWLKRVYGEENQLIKVGPFSMDVKKMMFYRNHESIELTAKEFEIMKIFMQNKGQIFSREAIIEKAF